MRWYKTTALLVALLLVVAACSSNDDAASTTTTTGAETTTSVAPTEPDPADVSFTVAVVEPDIASVPILAAVDALVAAGYDVDVVEVAEPELAIDGIARGEFEISGETISAALVAIQLGAPITNIGDVVGNAWTFYGRDDVAQCTDLDGTRIGIFSEGSVATAMIRQWVAENCPEIEADYLVIGGSDVRYQALVAGEINATALDLGEGLLLEDEEGQYNLLADFSKDLPELRPSTIYANADFVAESPEVVQLYIEALLEQHVRINEDPAYLADLAVTYLGGDLADWELVASAYASNDLFWAAALTEENLAYTIAFFEDAGVVEPGLTPADIAVLGPMRAAEVVVVGG